MDAHFAQMLSAVNAPQDFVAWLQKVLIHDAESFAFIATTEGDVQKDIVEVAKAEGVKLESLAEKVAIKKLWAMCRRSMAGPLQSSGAVARDQPLPNETEVDLKKRWSAAHGFVIPDAFMLISTLQGQLWRDATAGRPQFSVLLAERLRPLSCVDKKVGHQLAIVPGKPVETEEIIADQVFRPVELYIRCRALFYMLAYVCIYKPDYFDLQTAIFVSEKILSLIMTLKQGRSPPVDFLVAAWAATAHYFSEQLRITDEPLKKIVACTGSWEHLWGWTPTSQPASYSGGALASGSQQRAQPDLPEDMKAEMQKLQDKARKFQADKDKAESALRKQNRPNNDNKAKGGGRSGGWRDDRRDRPADNKRQRSY